MKYLSIFINTLLVTLIAFYFLFSIRITEIGLFKLNSFLGDGQMLMMSRAAEYYIYLTITLIVYYLLVLFFKEIIKSDVYIFIGSLKLSFLFLALSGFNELYLIPSVIMLLIAFLVNLKRIV